MIQIPADLAKLYTSFMKQKGLETDQHSGRKTRNGTSYGKSAAYGRTEPEVSSSHT